MTVSTARLAYIRKVSFGFLTAYKITSYDLYTAGMFALNDICTLAVDGLRVGTARITAFAVPWDPWPARATFSAAAWRGDPLKISAGLTPWLVMPRPPISVIVQDVPVITLANWNWSPGLITGYLNITGDYLEFYGAPE